MKLIDILVQELPKRGGWPEGAEIAVQDTFIDNDIKFGGKGCQIPTAEKEKHGDIVWRSDDWNFGSDIDFATEHPASDYATAIITREQYEAALAASKDCAHDWIYSEGRTASGYLCRKCGDYNGPESETKADDDGWIDWAGGECPVDTKTLVDIRLKVGFTYKSCHPGDYSWRHAGGGGDIIAYRLHKLQEVTEADDEADLNECIGQAPELVWNGEGLPPIGCECERSWCGDNWLACTVLFLSAETVVVKLATKEAAYGVSEVKFRPIRSEADKKRDEAKHTIAELCRSASSNGHAADLIYDAIAAGKVRGVKLED